MHLDTLGRRIRFAPPQPVGKWIEISKNDIAVFEAINRHGPLPTHYLFAFAGRENHNTFQKRLRRLFDWGYLIRRPEFFDSFFARYQRIVYDNGAKAEGHLNKPLIHRSDHLIHRLMGATFGASIELACRQKGYGYLDRSTVLERSGKAMLLPIRSQFIKQDHVEPDDVFGIHASPNKMYYAVEIDRSTEVVKESKNRKDTIAGKVKCYDDIRKHRTYEEIWGIANFRVLWVTTSEGRAESILEEVEKHSPKYAKHHAVKVIKYFDPPWEVPPALTDILDGWQGVKGAFDITKPQGITAFQP